jgi:hypothetical protein
LPGAEEDRDIARAQVSALAEQFNRAYGLSPLEAAALHRLLDAYIATESADPGLPDLIRVRERLSLMRQDHKRYAEYLAEPTAAVGQADNDREETRDAH